MLSLNVGGTLFATTRKTLQPLGHFKQLSDNPSQSDLFLDHDPVVFCRTLKVLRGYPCIGMLHDTDVLHQLCALKHEFEQVKLPIWLTNSIQQLSNTIHTLKPEQTVAFGETHDLVAEETIRQLGVLVRLGDIEDYELCRVVGVRVADKEWIDCRWVPKWEFELAKTKMKFLLYFCKAEAATLSE